MSLLLCVPAPSQRVVHSATEGWPPAAGPTQPPAVDAFFSQHNQLRVLCGFLKFL